MKPPQRESGEAAILHHQEYSALKDEFGQTVEGGLGRQNVWSCNLGRSASTIPFAKDARGYFFKSVIDLISRLKDVISSCTTWLAT